MRDSKFWRITVVLFCVSLLYLVHGLNIGKNEGLPSLVNRAHAGEVFTTAAGSASIYTTNIDGTQLHFWKTDEFGKPRYVGAANIDGDFSEPPRSAKGLLGTWKADIPLGFLGALTEAASSVEMTFKADGHFVSTNVHRDKTNGPVKNTTTGTYRLDRGRLITTDSNGTTSEGIVTMKGDSRFTLRLSDPLAKGLGLDSLEFSKK